MQSDTAWAVSSGPILFSILVDGSDEHISHCVILKYVDDLISVFQVHFVKSTKLT